MCLQVRRCARETGIGVVCIFSVALSVTRTTTLLDSSWFLRLTVKALNWYEDREARKKEFTPSSDVHREQVLHFMPYTATYLIPLLTRCYFDKITSVPYPALGKWDTRKYLCAICESAVYSMTQSQVPRRYDHCPCELGVLTSESQTDFFGTMTREIVKNYIDPTVNLDALTDGPHNAIASQHDMGMFFNNFLFSLKPTTNPNEYTALTYGEHIWLVPSKNRVVFEGDTPPDPGYLHLHACVADVLQRSGAGKVIDRILQCLPERTCPADIVDLQRVLDILELRYSLVAASKSDVCCIVRC
ncbi:hypothetical protein EDD85DRAFT_208600 [Armillaria nabsnona]|nr:hypothetical protein EDD85DRAFT_208600 [Armillaria nabsnona]